MDDGERTRQPAVPEDLAGFADIVEVGLSRDGRLVAVAVSLPDIRRNRYRRDLVTGTRPAPTGLRAEVELDAELGPGS